MMHECSLGEYLTAFKHHAGPTEFMHSQRVGIMHECSPGEYRLARAAFKHHAGQGHDALKHYAALDTEIRQLSVPTA